MGPAHSEGEEALGFGILIVVKNKKKKIIARLFFGFFYEVSTAARATLK